MTIVDRIKYDGSIIDTQWLIYKYPSEQLELGSQLIVNQGQEALFFWGGETLDLFGPGTHTLSTENLPILHKQLNFPFGRKTPFNAEIYYINKTTNLDLKWGTSTPVPLEDPKYGLILNIGARGQYGISILDSNLFVSSIIGAVPNGTTTNQILILRYFNGLINATIKSVTAGYMIKKKISFLEISQFLSELSDIFKDVLNGEFEKFGIEIVNFYCESISPNPKEYERLQRYKEELALGTEFYKQRRTFDIFEKLAENPSTSRAAHDIVEELSISKNIKTSQINIKLEKEHSFMSEKEKVFIVHGHDNEMKESVARFVENMGLIAIILHEQPDRGRTIIEKFEDYSNVSYAIILYSSDDKTLEGRNRARQNVVFEHGFFIGKFGRGKVIGLNKTDCDIELQSDLNGVLYIPFDSNWKFQLAKEMRGAGLIIDMNRLC